MQHKNLKNYVGHFLNVNDSEWGRLGIAWSTLFFFDIGAMLGWTMSITLFTGWQGKENLPYFFLLYAGFAVIGNIVFDYFSKELEQPNKQAVKTGFTLLLLLIFAYLSLNKSLVLFFILIFLARSTLYNRTLVLLSNFATKIFSPLEGERLIPVIGSARTIGSIFSGLMTTIITRYYEPINLIFIWGLTLIIFMAIFLTYQRYLQSTLPHISFKNFQHADAYHKHLIHNCISIVKRYKFISLLLIYVILLWIISIFIEYQFTFEIIKKATAEATDSMSMEMRMAQLLGMIYFFFAFGYLIFQLFLASRILKRFGIVKNIILHPVFSFFSAVALICWHKFYTAIFTRFQYDVTGLIISGSSIFVSCYSLPSKLRNLVKELLENIFKNMGTAIGSILLLIISKYFLNDNAVFLIDLVILVLVIVMLLVSLKLKKPFTELSVKALDHEGEHPDKYDAIDILAQPGHHKPTESLIISLESPSENAEIKVRILKALGKIKDPDTIPEILNATHNSNDHVKLAAVETMAEFKDLGKHFKNQVFTRKLVIETLHDLLKNPQIKNHIRLAIIKVFENLREREVTKVLLEILHDPDEHIRAGAVRAIGCFKDVAIIHYLNNSLFDPSPKVRANAIIALYQFKRQRLNLIKPLVQLIESENITEKISGIFAVGEIKAKQEIKFLEKCLVDKNHYITMYAALSLIKLGYSENLQILVDYILDENTTLSELAHKLTFTLPLELRLQYKKLLRKSVSKLIFNLVGQSEHYDITVHPIKHLKRIHDLYKLIDEEGIAMQMRMAVDGLNEEK